MSCEHSGLSWKPGWNCWMIVASPPPHVKFVSQTKWAKSREISCNTFAASDAPEAFAWQNKKIGFPWLPHISFAPAPSLHWPPEAKESRESRWFNFVFTYFTWFNHAKKHDRRKKDGHHVRWRNVHRKCLAKFRLNLETWKSQENVLSFSCAPLLQELHKNSNASTISKWSEKLPTARKAASQKKKLSDEDSKIGRWLNAHSKCKPIVSKGK